MLTEAKPLQRHELVEKAVKARLKRMARSLGWSALAATITDIVVRGTIGEGGGSNVLLFGGLAVVIYLVYRPIIQRADTTSEVWRSTRIHPWTIWYGLGAVMIMGAFTF